MDYSRAALTALLMDEECSVFETRRVLHNTSLGADSLVIHSASSRDNLARALCKITDLPLEDGNGAGLKHISELVLMDEPASDQQLKDVLKEVSWDQLSRLVTSDRRPRIIHPLFAASEGVAQDCEDRLNSQGDYELNISL